MKKQVFSTIVVGLVIVSSVMWMLNSELSFAEAIQFVVILVLIALAGVIIFKRIISVKRGEPTEDELSKKIMQKASSISFFISIYLWLGLMYVADKKLYETDIIFGFGILGMAIIFASSWGIIYFVGLKNEQ